MPTTKLKNGQLPDTISSKTVDNTNDINTTTTRLKITGGSNGQVLSTDGSGNLSWATAGGGTGSPTVYIVKSADETVINSNTAQDDDHLFTTLDANSYYYGEFRLLFTRANTSTTPAIRFFVSGGSLGFSIIRSPLSATNSAILDGTTSLGAITLDQALQVPMGAQIYFQVKTGSTTQDLKLRFAQNSVNATTGVTLMKGSSLILWKITTV